TLLLSSAHPSTRERESPRGLPPVALRVFDASGHTSPRGVKPHHRFRPRLERFAALIAFLIASNAPSLDDAASRVTRVGVDASIASKVPVAQYEYLGAARLVGTDLLEPKARW